MGATREIERRLLHVTRTAVRASPRLLEEYKRRHRYRWRERLLLAIFAALMLGIIAFGVSCYLYLWWTAPPHVGPRGSRNGDELASISASAGCVAVGSVIACAIALASYGGLVCSPLALHFLGHLPVTDRRLFRRSQCILLFLAGFGTSVLGVCSVILLDAYHVSASGRAGLIGLSVLEFWHLVSLLWLLDASGVTTKRMASVLSVGIVAGLCGVVTSLILAGLDWFATTRTVMGAIFFLSPVGWVRGAVEFGLARGNPLGWLYLAPVAITSIAALRWLRRGYAVREVVNGVAVFEYGVTNRPWNWHVSPNRDRGELVAAVFPPAPPPTENVVEARKRVVSGAWLENDPLPRWAVVERWVAAWLSPREREQFAREMYDKYMLTVFLMMSIAAVVVFGFCPLYVPRWFGHAPPAEQIRTPLMLIMIMVFGVSELLPHSAIAASKHWPRLPHDATAHDRLWLRIACARLPFTLLPPGVMLALLYGPPWQAPEAWLAVLTTAASVSLSSTYLPWLGLLCQPRNYRWDWLWFADLACTLLWLGSLLAMACTLVLPVIYLPLWAAALGVYLAITAIGIRWGRYRYLHTEFDVA